MQPSDGNRSQARGTAASSSASRLNVSPARLAAFDILLRIATSEAHSDDLLHSPRVATLLPEDRNLTTALVMGVLRWQIALDAQLAKLLARPDQRLPEPLAIALRIGAFQLLHMDRIPPHAAINESVELCRVAGETHATGMVNAILRKLTAQRNPTSNDQPARRTPIYESTYAFAARLGHPAWLVERWVANYGREAAIAICEYDQREPGSATFFSYPPTSLSENGPPYTILPQAPFPQIDDGSRLVAELAAAAAPPADRTLRIWDTCAAPGGKTLVLAQRLPDAGILATDISPRRHRQMEQRIAASLSGDQIHCEIADAAHPATPAAPSLALFDLILCDAPCSGTGTLARNPEIRRRLLPEDLARHASRQVAILRGALSQLAPGGRLLYSTCSLEPEENEQVIAALLSTQPHIRRLSLEPLVAGLQNRGILSAAGDDLARTATRGGYLRTLPGIHPCDGFFAALFERN